jgi:hypothetical protein
MNSRTSRPRSPTSATTFSSADVPRVIMLISVDLPTPEPEKMPMRCPRPHGTSVSSTRMPSDICSSTSCRSIADGGAASMLTRSPRSGGPPSIGRPSPSRMRPRRSGPTATRSGPPVETTGLPVPIPMIGPSGRHERRSPSSAATSANTASSPSPIRSSSPTRASSPLTVTRRPTAPVSFPRRSGWAAWIAASTRLRNRSVKAARPPGLVAPLPRSRRPRWSCRSRPPRPRAAMPGWAAGARAVLRN